MPAADEFRRWFDYEKDCHAKVLGALGAVPEPGRAAPEYRRSVTLMAHIVAARRVWLFRLGAERECPQPADFFPEGVTLPDLARRVDHMHAAWSGYLSRLDDAAAARPFEYRSFEGEWFRTTVADILTQLFGHSSYHRGQIALLLRSGGFEPVTTDFVYWAREAIPPPAGAE